MILDPEEDVEVDPGQDLDLVDEIVIHLEEDPDDTDTSCVSKNLHFAKNNNASIRMKL